jgi:hypothetical protein
MANTRERRGDREYLWFALLLIAVLATSVVRSQHLRHPSPETASDVP